MSLHRRVNTIPDDYRIILDMIDPGSSVLDLGCGDGALLDLLVKQKGCRVQGIEIDYRAIHACVAKGLSVFHSDIDQGLAEFHDGSFDAVILNQSMQEVKNVRLVLEDALRVGKNVIVGFPNFAHARARLQILFRGRAPVTKMLQYSWYDTPNLHFLSIEDFRDYCAVNGITVRRAAFTGRRCIAGALPNLFAVNGIFMITRPARDDTALAAASEGSA